MTNAVYLASLVNSSGNNVTLQGGVVGSGTGIAFPATQVASSDANTLDDYEEGTWTPVIGGSSGQSGQTYTATYGRYVKVGSLVTLTFQVALTAKGTISGTYTTLQGFPFTTLSGTGSSGGVISYYAGLNSAYYWVGFYADASSTFGYITANTSSASNIQYIGPAQISNNTTIIGSITYVVA